LRSGLGGDRRGGRGAAAGPGREARRLRRRGIGGGRGTEAWDARSEAGYYVTLFVDLSGAGRTCRVRLRGARRGRRWAG
jgi:hypothetical protein